MDSTEMKERYITWMVKMIMDKDHPFDVINEKFNKLIYRLFLTDFYYNLPMDSNRYEDGINLRYRFGREMGYTPSMIATYLDYFPCSILEMMIALCCRCEEQIAIDPDSENNVSGLFWSMVKNIGIEGMTNDAFDTDYFDLKMRILLDREYTSDGYGNFFCFDDRYLASCHCRPLRDIEIWYQMHMYLDYISKYEEYEAM